MKRPTHGPAAKLPRLVKSRPNAFSMSDGQNASLSNRAYFLIRERILRGQLRPGDVLSRRTIAHDLGMSLLPVSEAFKRLENDHLLESRPRAGTRVRIPSLSEIHGHCIVREALETQSARLCASRATPKQMLELERLAEQLDALYLRFHNDPGLDLQFVVHTHHFELHMRIAEYAGCLELQEAIERNNVLIHNWFFDLAADRTSLPAGFHRRLVEAIVAGKPQAADAAMRHHVRYGIPGANDLAGEWRKNEWRLPRQYPAT